MITNQALLFSIFVINGLIIGLVFDTFRILRLSFKTKDLVTYIEDILFWIITGVIVLYSIFVFNNGEIRFYIFLGIIIGFVLYMMLISNYIIKSSVGVIKFFKNIIRKILKTIIIPFKFIGKTLKRIFLKPVSIIIINVKKNIKKIATIKKKVK